MPMTVARGLSWMVRRFVTAAVLVVAILPFGARADVVPSAAVALADRWFALADAGRMREAVDACFDDPGASTARAQATHPAPAPLRDRTIRSWSGHGEGDVSRMAPGGYFALVYDGVDAGGRPQTVELRMVPRGDDGTRWRLVDVVAPPSIHAR